MVAATSQTRWSHPRSCFSSVFNVQPICTLESSRLCVLLCHKKWHFSPAIPATIKSGNFSLIILSPRTYLFYMPDCDQAMVSKKGLFRLPWKCHTVKIYSLFALILCFSIKRRHIEKEHSIHRTFFFSDKILYKIFHWLMLIHSFRSFSYDRSTATSKTRSLQRTT
jgi:hypothetical protein